MSLRTVVLLHLKHREMPISHLYFLLVFSLDNALYCKASANVSYTQCTTFIQIHDVSAAKKAIMYMCYTRNTHNGKRKTLLVVF